jgi:type II secretion system protein N
MSKKRKWFGYTIYCTMLTVLLLYYRFPSGELRDYLRVAVSNLNTPILLSVDRVTPWLPFGLRLEKTEFTLKDSPTTRIFWSDSLLVKPDLWSFLKKENRYCFECMAYGGDARGCVLFSENNVSAPFSTEVEVENVQIGDNEYINGLLGRMINGNLSGTMHYSGQRKDLISGNGGANLTLADGSVELLLPILGMNSISFSEIIVHIALNKRKINLDRFDLSGPQLKASLSGNINLRRRISGSTLDLKGAIEPYPAFFNGAAGGSSTMGILTQRLKTGTLRFIIRGTLREPKITFT